MPLILFYFQALREILDSPLNQAGMVGAVYVKTDSGINFEVKPCVRAKDSGEVLLQVLKKPAEQHIPENAQIIGLSYSSEKVVDIEDYLSATKDDSDLVFVVGTMVHGKVSRDSTTDYISGNFCNYTDIGTANTILGMYQ
uniref:Uncharacterized protein n=2 Tax=Chenopodium quinoa TaxID=63459 RepID=A0A803LZJ9_CHEQI